MDAVNHFERNSLRRPKKHESLQLLFEKVGAISENLEPNQLLIKIFKRNYLVNLFTFHVTNIWFEKKNWMNFLLLHETIKHGRVTEKAFNLFCFLFSEEIVLLTCDVCSVHSQDYLHKTNKILCFPFSLSFHFALH